MEENKKGLIYYRVSTEDQAQFGVSLDQQKRDGQKYAENNNIEIIKMFHDDGVSAKTADRPGLQAMLEYCTKHYKEVNCVIVYKVDRLSRNVNDYTNILILLNKLNIKLISTTEAIDETPTGKFIGNIMAANAQFDNDIRSQRTSACMVERLRQGYWCWKAKIGYLNTQDVNGKSIIVVDPKRAHHISWIFKEFSKGLSTLEKVRIKVNKRGFRTWNGNEISLQLMSKIINDKFYIGIMTSKGIEYQGVHPKLTDKQTFYKCQEILKKHTKGDNIAKKKYNKEFPLRHFVECAHCGRPLTAYFAKGRWGGKYPYYHCYNKDCPSRKIIKRDDLEDKFIDYLKKEVIPTQKYLNAFKHVVLDVWNTNYKKLNEDAKKRNRELERLKQEKIKLIQMKQKDLISDEDFKEMFELSKQQIIDCEISLTQVKTQEFDIDKAVNYVFDFIPHIPEIWKKTDDYDKKIKIQGLVFPEKVTFDNYKFQTPVLCPILATERQFRTSVSTKAAPRGFEPRLLE